VFLQRYIKEKEKKMEMPLNTTQKSTTAGNIAFLLLSFPFGLLYFLVTVIGFTLGLSTLVIWIGIPILFATVAMIRGMAAVERGIVASLLRVPFPRQPHMQGQPRQTFTRRFGNSLRADESQLDSTIGGY
jgi:hypothetical protein